MFRFIAVATLSLLSVNPAFASSDDAWAQFAVDVEQACIDATEGLVTDPKVVVDPFGSESFGLALVTGTSANGATSSIICVFDKQSKAVQIGGELEFMVEPTDEAHASDVAF